MSWLSEALGGGNNEAAAKKKRDAEKKEKEARNKEKEAKKRFRQQLNQGMESGRDSAEAYFTNYGADPAQYADEIERAIQEARASIPDGISNPGAYFKDVGKNVYSQLTEALRGRSMRGLDQAFQPGFADQRIQGSADDAIIEEILGASRGEADKYIQNLLDRGVVTQTGYDAARADLDAQQNKARGNLSSLGDTILSGGRSRLSGIVDQGRQRASTLSLGDNFDVGEYGNQVNSAFDDFMAGLGNTFKAQAPTNLFDTSGLTARAGAAQGPQNTKFSSKATGGIYDDEDDDEERGLGNVF